MTDQAGGYRRRVLRNVAANSLANAWSMVVTFIALPFLLDGLGATSFGLWALLLTFSAAQGWFLLADLGVGVSTTRFVAERESIGDTSGSGRIAGTSGLLFLLLAILFSSALALMGPPLLTALFDVPTDLEDSFATATRLWAGALFFEMLGRWAQAVLEGVQRLDLARVGATIRQTLLAIATAAVAQADGGLEGVAAAALGASTLACATTVLLVRPRMRPSRLSSSRADARVLLGYGSRVWALSGVDVAHRTMDRIIVGVVLGPAAVALVEIAARVQSAATAVLAATSYAALSSAPWVKARRATAMLRDLLLRGTKYSVLATYPIVIGLGLLAGPLIDVWLGEEWSEAAGLVTIGMVYVAMSAPLAVGANMLQGGGQATLVLRSTVLALIVNLVTSVILVDQFGIVGAYIGTIIGSAVLTVPLTAGFLSETHTALTMFARSALLPVAAPALAMAGAITLVFVFGLPALPTLLLGGALGAGVFAVVTLRWSLEPGEVRTMLRDVSPGG